jgi:thiol:disulfide interchange protein DsbD
MQIRSVALAGVGLAVTMAGVRATAQVPPPARRHVVASIVAEREAIRPGRPLLVGVWLRMEPGWHTYWRNPGDSGLPTRVRWQLPEGFTAGDIQWPYPSRFSTGPLVSYGYEREVLLPVELRVPASLAAREVRLAAHVDWLECQEICLPGKADLGLVLPVRAGAAPSAEAALFAEVRERLPVKDPTWRFEASAAREAIGLTVHPPRRLEIRSAYLYPVTPRVLDYSRPQTLGRSGGAWRLELVRDPNGAADTSRLAGVLVVETPRDSVALEVDVPIALRTAGPVPTSNPDALEKKR